jgi:hypothetical protein
VPEQWVEYICGETLSRLSEIQDPDGIIELAEDGIKIAIKK